MLVIAVNLWEKLIQWDHALFKKINQDWTNPLFDWTMPFLRNQYNWLPLYIFVIIFVLLNFKLKGLWWLVFFFVTIAMADMTGTKFFKYGIERVRPCNIIDLAGQVRLLVRCPSGYGFTSNHAANHFGMATFFFITFRHLFKNWVLLVLLWAGAIAYAQVYVGVHFPADVIAGALLGIMYGSFTGWQFNKHFRLQIPEIKNDTRN